jgi:hypothetical protein
MTIELLAPVAPVGEIMMCMLGDTYTVFQRHQSSHFTALYRTTDPIDACRARDVAREVQALTRRLTR